MKPFLILTRPAPSPGNVPVCMKYGFCRAFLPFILQSRECRLPKSSSTVFMSERLEKHSQSWSCPAQERKSLSLTYPRPIRTGRTGGYLEGGSKCLRTRLLTCCWGNPASPMARPQTNIWTNSSEVGAIALHFMGSDKVRPCPGSPKGCGFGGKCRRCPPHQLLCIVEPRE